MAERLNSNLVLTGKLAEQIDTPQFRAGYVEGLTGKCRRFNITLPASEAGLVEIVRNLVEVAQEGWLNEEQLRHDVGLLAGWVARQTYRADEPH